MKIISKYILTNVLGWEIKDKFPDIKKSVIIFAPHTSYFDGLYGKLYLMHSGINYKFLSNQIQSFLSIILISITFLAHTSSFSPRRKLPPAVEIS